MKKIIPVVIILALAALITVPFWLHSSLDIDLSQKFYHAGMGDGWPEAKNSLYEFLYRGAPVLAILTGLLGVVGIVVGTVKPAWHRFRLWGTAVFLALALGPGLVVNALGKDHAGRPRPRQIVELGGTLSYRPPLMFGRGDGKSFPCGHCSVGFVLGIFALLIGRRRCVTGWAIFIFSILLGGGMGIARMAAGAHFFSDVLWSGLLTYSVVWLVYFKILRVPEREADPARFPALGSGNRWMVGAGIGAAVCAFVGIALLSTPYEQSIDGTLSFANASSVSLMAPSVNITLEIIDAKNAPALAWQGSFKGFGFPGRKVEVRPDNVSSAMPVVDFHKHGFFTDLEGPLTIKINAAVIKSVEIQLPASAILTTHDETKKKISVKRTDL